MSDRPSSQRDALIVAALHGASSRHAGWRPPTGPARELALLDLRAIATDDGTLRADLLAEAAGVCLAFGQREEAMAPHHRHQAALLLDAGADPDLLARWTEIGRERAAGGARAGVGGGSYRSEVV